VRRLRYDRLSQQQLGFLYYWVYTWFLIEEVRLVFCVQAVLYYYQSGGRLRRPIEVPEDVFLEELEFYRISDETIRQYKEKEGFLMEKKKALPTKSWQRNVWLFCEEPESSKAAKVACFVTSRPTGFRN